VEPDDALFPIHEPRNPFKMSDPSTFEFSKPDLVAIIAGILIAPSTRSQGLSVEEAAAKAVRVVDAAQAAWNTMHASPSSSHGDFTHVPPNA
jgi:hypothetical protein